MWKSEETTIEGLKIMTPFFMNDNRGSFIKCFEKDIYQEFGLEDKLSEIFVTTSKQNVIRGLHFQINHPQTKYVTVLSGIILDVAVDLRRNSKTFGKWEAIELSQENHKVFCIPKGFAHGFQVVSSEDAIVLYQCAGKFDRETDTGIIWSDENLSIKWASREEAIISDKDANLITLKEFIRDIEGLEG